MKKTTKISFISVCFLLGGSLVSSSSLEVFPETFDFGWCPKNAKVSCDFTLKNTTTNLIPILQVESSCGCTATDFSPSDLTSNAEMSVGLTFNTFGYDGRLFYKKAKVKTDLIDQSYEVYLKGKVDDAEAKVRPVGSGIAKFDPTTKKDKEVISILNQSEKEVTVDLIQAPADWAEIKLANPKIKPGETTDLVVFLKAPAGETKHTSATWEAREAEGEPHRFTVAIQTGGASAPPKRKLRAPAAP